MKYAVVDNDGQVTFHDEFQDADASGTGHEYTIWMAIDRFIVTAVQWYGPTGDYRIMMDVASITEEELVKLAHYAAEKYNKDHQR